MKIRNAFAIIALGMGVTAIILFGWIGFVFAINTYTPVAMTAEAALNLILVLLLATAGLPILHAAVYRWFWHIRRRREAGAYSRGEPIPAFGSEPTAPPRAPPRRQGNVSFIVRSTSSESCRSSPPMRRSGIRRGWRPSWRGSAQAAPPSRAWRP